MTETEMKLWDAATQMKLALAKADDEGVVRSCVNSFISSARSVTFVMQRESSSSDDLKRWYEQQMNTLKDSAHFRFFNARRVYSIHRGVVIPRKQVIPVKDFRASGIPQPDVESVTFLQFDDAEEFFPGGSGGVFRLCEEYFRMLRQLVEAWVAKRSDLGIP